MWYKIPSRCVLGIFLLARHLQMSVHFSHSYWKLFLIYIPGCQLLLLLHLRVHYCRKCVCEDTPSRFTISARTTLSLYIYVYMCVRAWIDRCITRVVVCISNLSRLPLHVYLSARADNI